MFSTLIMGERKYLSVKKRPSSYTSKSLHVYRLDYSYRFYPYTKWRYSSLYEAYRSLIYTDLLCSHTALSWQILRSSRRRLLFWSASWQQSRTTLSSSNWSVSATVPSHLTGREWLCRLKNGTCSFTIQHDPTDCLRSSTCCDSLAEETWPSTERQDKRKQQPHFRRVFPESACHACYILLLKWESIG